MQASGTQKKMPTEEARWRKIERFLKKNGSITNVDVRNMFDISAATASRILAKLAADGKLQKTRIGSTWGYTL